MPQTLACCDELSATEPLSAALFGPISRDPDTPLPVSSWPFLRVAYHDWSQDVPPAIGAVHVARTRATPLQVAELVEWEKRMIADAAEVTVVGRAFLVAVGRADVGVHVEDDFVRRTAVVNPVDLLPRQIRKDSEGVVEFPERYKSGIGGDPRPRKFQLPPTVEILPRNPRFAFTRRVSRIEPQERQKIMILLGSVDM